ncbi:CoA-binding protein [Polaribacter aestuariivivens]|uniref:CoA-binding protein n=1 Tax=Polaribacter aestuariivivens TaxID=2304626 RepID=UPI003F496146
MNQKTLVIGASLKENRYSNRAIKKLKATNIDVVAIGLKKGTVANVSIDTEKKMYENVHTVTLYLNPKRQEEYYNYIISLKPNRVIFNPGTENMEFLKLLKENNIKSEIACTLVLLATNQY